MNSNVLLGIIAAIIVVLVLLLGQKAFGQPADGECEIVLVTYNGVTYTCIRCMFSGIVTVDCGR